MLNQWKIRRWEWRTINKETKYLLVWDKATVFLNRSNHFDTGPQHLDTSARTAVIFPWYQGEVLVIVKRSKITSVFLIAYQSPIVTNRTILNNLKISIYQSSHCCGKTYFRGEEYFTCYEREYFCISSRDKIVLVYELNKTFIFCCEED